MPFIPVPEAVEVRMEYTLGGAEQMVNVLHFHNITPVEMTPTRSAALAGIVATSWADNLKDKQSSDVVLQAITVKDISAADLPSYRFPQGDAGTAVGELLPFNAALVTTLYTAVGSRGGRGRIFHGGFTEADNDGGDAATTDLADACTAFASQIATLSDVDGDAGADYNLGVVSRHAHVGGDPDGAPVAPVVRDVFQITTNRRWDSQRRRSNKIRI